MKHFQTNLQCKIIHLDISYNTFKEKVDETCFQSRGIVNPNHLTMKEFYYQRKNLYDLYSDVSINMDDKEIGFKNTANLYSIADTNKYGGSIGWVDEISLSDKISKILSKTNLGDYTETIKIGANFLILKVDNIKFEKSEIDEEKEFNKIYNFEIDKKLEQFSKIYFNKVKINTKIHEL